MNAISLAIGTLTMAGVLTAFLLPRDHISSSQQPAEETPRTAAPERMIVRLTPEFPDMSVEQLVRGASRVVVGTIESSDHTAPDAGYPYDQYQVQVAETFTGAGPNSLAVRVYGGASASYDLVMQGAPKFAAGERVLLFLTTAPSLEYAGVFGLNQGVYRLSADVNADYGSATSLHNGVSMPAVDLIGSVLDAEAKIQASSTPTPR